MKTRDMIIILERLMAKHGDMECVLPGGYEIDGVEIDAEGLFTDYDAPCFAFYNKERDL